MPRIKIPTSSACGRNFSRLRDGRRLSKPEHRSLTCVAHRPQVRVPRLPIGLSKSVTSFGNRKPSATAPGVAAAGRIDRDAHNASLVAQRDVALRAIWQSGVDHPDNVVPNNNGSTIGTNHADLPDRSNPSSAKLRGAATHSLRNSSGKHNVRSSKTSRAQTSLPEIPVDNRSCICRQIHPARAFAWESDRG
jgi:hypothetical protein